MLPRPLLTETFRLAYRKIPVLAIGRDVYCDTSLIVEALEHFFPSPQYGTVYPPVFTGGEGGSKWDYRGLVRGFASFWTDRPFFRITTGLIPSSVWHSDFGTDRSQLIGHKLDAEKLGAKVPSNLSALDTHLSIFESILRSGKWLFPTVQPSLADVSLYYQLRWGIDIASGKGIYNLTGGSTPDTFQSITDAVFNEQRYPGLWMWFNRFEEYLAKLPDLGSTIKSDDTTWKEAISKLDYGEAVRLVPTFAKGKIDLDEQRGLVPGTIVSVAPDDTGRDNPTIGRLVQISVEEVVIEPLKGGEVDVNIHFPKVGFVVKTVGGSKL